MFQPLGNPAAPGGSAAANQVFNFAFARHGDNGDIWVRQKKLHEFWARLMRLHCDTTFKTINGVQYESPSVPTLLNILAHGFTNEYVNRKQLLLSYSRLFQFWLPEIWEHFCFKAKFRCRGILHRRRWTPVPFTVRNSYHFLDKTDEILLLSGHAFSVVQSASGGNANFVNPPRRDVVASGTSPTNNQSVRIRFRTDNPGKQSNRYTIS